MTTTAQGLDPKSYRSVGTTHDGVSVLKPKTKPTHFTTREIRTTIRNLKRQVRDTNATAVHDRAGTNALDP